MPINADRIKADLDAIAACTATPGEGATRPTFSPAWAKARAHVVTQLALAGCDLKTDPCGNLHARPRDLGWETPAWLCGSHLDSVPHGGDYDGVVGVVVALELLRSAADDRNTALPVELVVFAEEEGPTFGLGMLGSRAWVGQLTAGQLGQLKNADGQTYLQAGVSHGVEPYKIGTDPICHECYRGFIEVHIEQGPGLWRRDQRLAIVTTIAGRRQLRVTIRGEANHAGATAMGDRRDALAGAAQIWLELEQGVATLSEGAVLTVGRVAVRPNAVNVIPDRVEFTIDFRAERDGLLFAGAHEIARIVEIVGGSRGLQYEIEQTEEIGARELDGEICGRLADAGRALGLGELPKVMSGALHDSAVLAPHVPTAMVFVASRDGVSHNPAEFSRIEDVAAAAKLVERLVRSATLAELNAAGQAAFVGVVGGAFEHSPWVAERAWPLRPFRSVDDLHEKMVAAVKGAAPDEQLALIKAHPDLVGRLAREGKLTAESTAEQAAAGLDALSPAEAAKFEQLNAAYREKFGFPFVICARQNRKEAILAAFPTRLANPPQQEVATALAEVYKIARLRLADTIVEQRESA